MLRVRIHEFANNEAGAGTVIREAKGRRDEGN